MLLINHPEPSWKLSCSLFRVCGARTLVIRVLIWQMSWSLCNCEMYVDSRVLAYFSFTLTNALNVCLGLRCILSWFIRWSRSDRKTSAAFSHFSSLSLPALSSSFKCNSRVCNCNCVGRCFIRVSISLLVPVASLSSARTLLAKNGERDK